MKKYWVCLTNWEVWAEDKNEAYEKAEELLKNGEEVYIMDVEEAECDEKVHEKVDET